jgi:hypothetical protein
MPKNKQYIYESPDGGKTVTRRAMGSDMKEKVYLHGPEFNEMLPSEKKQIGIDILQGISKLLKKNKGDANDVDI